MRRLFTFFALWVSLTILVGEEARIPSEDALTEARAAASAWLQLVDSAEYAASWKQTAPVFQERVSPERWEEMVAAVRQPLGAVQERELLRADFTRSLPGVPPGGYVVLQFTTHFANHPRAVETITPMRVDGQWRVAGYYVR